MFDEERHVASNGTSRPYTNGKAQQRSQPGASANGTHKPAVTLNGSSKSRALEDYFGHDREEITRILIQTLSDMGYRTAAESVSRESGFNLESPTVAAFRSAILEGSWSEAEQLLSGASISGERAYHGGNGLVLANGADRNLMRFWIRQQKFLELLENRATSQALGVLRTELTPLYQDVPKLHFLSSLIMCQTREDLLAKAGWDGAYGRSRQTLLSELSKCISPSVMLPEHRLATLLHQVKASQIGACLWHSSSESPSLYSDHRCDRRRFPTESVLELDDHDGEVWHLAFSHDGTRLASCGSDKQVIIWEVPSFKVLHRLTDHDDGIGNVAWSWDDTKLVTCCRDRYARLWDTELGICIRKLERFAEPACSCVWAPNDETFITGSLDKGRGLVEWSASGDKVAEWPSDHRVEDLTVSPNGRWLVAMDDRHHVQVYNLMTREFEYKIDLNVRLMSVSISEDSRHLLVNHQNGVAQLIDLFTREPVQSYTGHNCGDQFVIRSTFGGADESFVVSGSDDGLIHIWHKVSAQLVEKLSGHSPRCNSVSWSPTDPCLFASCGDDGKVKIWSNNDWRRTHMGTMYRNPNTS